MQSQHRTLMSVEDRVEGRRQKIGNYIRTGRCGKYREDEAV